MLQNPFAETAFKKVLKHFVFIKTFRLDNQQGIAVAKEAVLILDRFFVSFHS